MEHSGSKLNDRRRGFRIEDLVHFSYKVLKEDEEAGGGELSPVAQLRELSNQASHILAAIRKREPEIGQYLAILDKKLEIVARMQEEERLGDESKPNVRASLSQYGLSFHQKKALASDTRLQIKLIFFPSLLSIECGASVKYSTRIKDNPPRYRVGIEFENMGEKQEDALIRYMIERQSEILRKEKELSG